ncbi:hypothetical protein Scep_030805 [Stephania cephalantha]|uniref:Uncharacterized protein n=1 Tax=Stephania cephalantha TaxID=152367 RepID=A0AAP0E0C3_9MAGN
MWSVKGHRRSDLKVGKCMARGGDQANAWRTVKIKQTWLVESRIAEEATHSLAESLVWKHSPSTHMWLHIIRCGASRCKRTSDGPEPHALDEALH